MARAVRPSGVLERVAEQVDRGQKPDIYKAAIERLEVIVTAQAARIEALEDSVAQLEAFKRDNDGIVEDADSCVDANELARVLSERGPTTKSTLRRGPFNTWDKEKANDRKSRFEAAYETALEKGLIIAEPRSRGSIMVFVA